MEEAGKTDMVVRRPGRQQPVAGLRIAMVAACPFPARRGTPLRIQRLAETLTRRGHHVEVFTYDVGDADPLPFPVHRTGRQLRREAMPPGPNLRKLLLDPRLAGLLAARLADTPFDLVHAHHVEGLLVALWARRRRPMPVIYDAHTMLGSELPTYGRGPVARTAAWAGRLMDRRLPRLADGVVAVTEDIRERLVAEGGCAPERVVVAMNGVGVEQFAPPPGVAERPGRVIYTGTLAGYQDVDLLLRAFARARAERPEMSLCLSVSSSFAPFEPMARELGIMESIEVVEDRFDTLPARLAASAIAALPRTRCDGIPQKLLNYMAAGKAVVASAGSAKVLEHGRTGLVVPDNDEEAFGKALATLAARPDFAHALGRAARRFVERCCTWGAAAEKVEGLYATVLGFRFEPAAEQEPPLARHVARTPGT